MQKNPEYLWQFRKGDPNDNITDSDLFKARITGRTFSPGNTKNVEKVVLLKYLSDFGRTLEVLLINCEIHLILIWSVNCVITNSTDPGTFERTYTKLYVLVVTLSNQDNTKILKQLKSGFKRKIG